MIVVDTIVVIRFVGEIFKLCVLLQLIDLEKLNPHTYSGMHVRVGNFLC